MKKEKTMANKTLTVDQIRTRGAVEGVTPYQIARLINAELAAVQIDPIRPQMMYNYDRNGLIVKGLKNLIQTRNYTLVEADAFVDTFVAKKVAKVMQTPKATVVDPFENVECEGQMDLLEV